MKMKIAAGLAFLLNTFLFATYYSVAKGALARIDPIVFTFFVMIVLLPAALCMLAFSWRHLTRDILKSGALLGSCLCLGLFTLAVALKHNSATSTAFFPSLNGFVAAIITWLFLRQPITRATWFAGIVSVGGAMLLIMNSPMGGVRGSLIAFIGGLLCTLYVFLADYEQRDKTAYWALFGVELLTMAIWASLLALLFGDWQFVHPALPKDLWAILYIAFGTTFLPTLITVLLQKYISPITVSFIYILEPILGAVIAYLYLRESLPLIGYLGGGLVVVGAFINTWGTAERPASSLTLRWRIALAGQQTRGSLLGTLGYPLLCLSLGVFAVYKLAGFPPAAWRELYLMWIAGGQGQSMSSVPLLVAQALSWLIAWSSLLIMGALTVYRAINRVYSVAKTPAPDLVLDRLDARTLRQLGVKPATVAATRRKQENQLVQRRRQARRERLTQVEYVEFVE